MYNTKDILKARKYSKDYILNYIGDLDLFKKYIPGIKLKKAMKSPIRDDKLPSFSIFQISDGTILYKDHASGDSGDIFKFLKQYWGCTLKDVYKRIVDDYPTIGIIPQKKEPVVIQSVDIGVKRRYFTSNDITYWSKYFISKQTLYKYKVNAIEYYAINGVISNPYTNSDPLYSYKVNEKFKLYRPLTLNKLYKWRGNLNNNDIFGYEQLLKKGDLLIITKSLKDVMVLSELGYTAIAPASETTVIDCAIIEDLKERFNDVVLFFDNDMAGIKNANKMSKLYNLPKMQIGDEYKVKDISDFIVIHERERTEEYLKHLLYENLQNTKA